MYLNHGRMTIDDRLRIHRWLKSNGCRDYVALLPIVVHGNVAEYWSYGRVDAKRRNPSSVNCLSPERLEARGWELPVRRKRLRLRIPLHRVAQ